MNKKELISEIMRTEGMEKKEATVAVEAVIKAISNAVAAEDNVQLIGFGTFSVKKRASRKCKNPQTGEFMVVPASKSVTFKPGKKLKDMVNC